MAQILLARVGGALEVTLNRPKALNALTLEMVHLFAAALKKGGALQLAASADTPAAVIMKGAGEKAFCAGGDIRAIFDGRGKTAQQAQFFRDEYEVDYLLGKHGATVSPHVALWRGIVMGGGVGVSIHAPFRVATETTTFAMPETGIGFFPDVGGSWFLPRLSTGPAFGLYLALTGARLSGADTVHAGVATHLVPNAALPALEADLHSLPAAELKDYKARHAAVEETVSRHATPSSSLPPFSLGAAELGVINRCFSAASVPEVIQRLRGEPEGAPHAPLVKKALAALERMSPTSLAVTHEQLRRGGELRRLSEVYEMELRLACAFLAGGGSGSSGGADFYEGVRAVLVDKDNKPKWSPASLQDVSTEAVQRYFAPLGEDLKSLPPLGLE